MRSSRKTIPWARPQTAALVAMLVASSFFLTACESTSSNGDDPGLRGSSLRMARRAAADGNTSMVAMFADKAHIEEPKKLEPLLLLGDSLLAQHEPAAAVEAYGRALALAPQDVRAQDGYGRALIALGRANMAQTIFEGLVAAHPQDVRGLNGLAVALDMQGQHTQAQERYRQALALSPGQTSTANNLALSLILDGAPEEAIALLAPIAASPSAPARYRQNLALAYGLAGQDAKAREWASNDLDADSVKQNMALYRAARDGRVNPLSTLSLDKGQGVETKPVSQAVTVAAADSPAATLPVESAPAPVTTRVPEAESVSVPPVPDAAVPAAVEPVTVALPPPVTEPAPVPTPIAAPQVHESSSAPSSADELNRAVNESMMRVSSPAPSESTASESDEIAARVVAKVLAEAQVLVPTPDPLPDVSFNSKPIPVEALAAQEDIATAAQSASPSPESTTQEPRIQLAALKKREALEKERDRLMAKHQSDWTEFSLEIVSPYEHDAPNRRFYRLQLMGISNSKKAFSMCNKLNEQGTDCFVVTH
ncbi:MAG: tetratricopeptide repeat protein [Alphaproteobacteria bacterium]|nr:MAG: tetratricopeptide repeat protein [Alphaproteobacteria bacterium]